MFSSPGALLLTWLLLSCIGLGTGCKTTDTSWSCTVAHSLSSAWSLHIHTGYTPTEQPLLASSGACAQPSPSGGSLGKALCSEACLYQKCSLPRGPHPLHFDRFSSALLLPFHCLPGLLALTTHDIASSSRLFSSLFGHSPAPCRHSPLGNLPAQGDLHWHLSSRWLACCLSFVSAVSETA